MIESEFNSSVSHDVFAYCVVTKDLLTVTASWCSESSRAQIDLCRFSFLFSFFSGCATVILMLSVRWMQASKLHIHRVLVCKGYFFRYDMARLISTQPTGLVHCLW